MANDERPVNPLFRLRTRGGHWRKMAKMGRMHDGAGGRASNPSFKKRALRGFKWLVAGRGRRSGSRWRS